jgi:vitellogenic carboxypeptidase-like protein
MRRTWAAGMACAVACAAGVAAQEGALLLTPLLQAGKVDEARAAAQVVFPQAAISPNAPAGWTPPTSYSGFVTVNATTNATLFFWLFTPSTAAADSPVVYWQQGGPGADDEFGLFVELGPLQAEVINGTGFVLPRSDAISWCPSDRRCLFIDQPVFTGFSFANEVSAIPPTLVESTEQLVGALVQIYSLFPELSQGPLIVCGESYGGRYAPALGAALAARFATGATPVIPLRAIAVGDGWVDPRTHLATYADAVYGLGILDPVQHDELGALMQAALARLDAGDNVGAFALWNSFWGDCGGPCGLNVPSGFNNQTGCQNTLNFLETNYPAFYGNYGALLARADVRAALHVGNTPFGAQSGNIYRILATVSGDFMVSSLPDLLQVLQAGYDVLLYNGNLDALLGAAHGYAIAQALDWPGYEAAPKQILTLDNGTTTYAYVRQVGTPGSRAGASAGPSKSADPWFAQLILRDAGHIAMADQPVFAAAMIQPFIRGTRFL